MINTGGAHVQSGPPQTLLLPSPQDQDQYGNPVSPQNTTAAPKYEGPQDNKADPMPVITNVPAVPPTLSYQAAIGKAIQPMINQLGGTTNLSSLNQALAGLPQAAASNAAMPNLSQGIASTLTAQISDYQTGLNQMLAQSGTATPLQDILKGMGELLSYPTATSLTGNQGAPGGVAGNATLQEVYAELNNLRNGLGLTTGLNGESGYGANPLATATGT